MNLSPRILSARARVEARLIRLFPGPFGHVVDVSAVDDPDNPPDGRPERGIDGRAALVVCLVAALSVALAGFLLWRARPQSADVGPMSASNGVASPAPAMQTFVAASVVPSPTESPTAAPDDPGVTVDVQGRVRRPGVVNLPTGARVRDALNAVGGPRPGVSTRSLNLAAPVSDGEQIVLGPACGDAAAVQAPAGALPAAPAATTTTPGGSSRPARTANAVIDLNRATVAELETLPGVGPVLAQRIVDYRTTHGRFTSVDELREVSGIGPAKFAEIRSRVRV